MTARVLSFFLLSGVLASASRAEQITVRVSPKPFGSGCTASSGACGYGSAEDPSRSFREFIQTNREPQCASFTDPLPAGAIVKSVDVRASYLPRQYFDTASGEPRIYLDRPSSTNPAYLIGSFTREIRDLRIRCEPPFDPFALATVTGPTVAKGVPGYVYGGVNGLYSDLSGAVLFYEFFDVTIHYTKPVIKFDLDANSDERQRRVLVRRWRDDVPYFSTAQDTIPTAPPGRDGRIRIAGLVTDEDGPVADQTVYLRVIDPPDTSAYVPAASQRRGDNVNGPGSLAATTVTTDLQGRFETVLTTTRFASGDNYQVEGSTIPNFGGRVACDTTNNCVQTGVITAWKRVHLEVGQMFRRGSFLEKTTAVGASEVEVHDVGPFHSGDRVVLLLGPVVPRFGPSAPATEYQKVVRTIVPGGVVPAGAGGTGVLKLDQPLPFVFKGIDGNQGHASVLADFVGVEAGNPDTDHYQPNLSYVPGLFGAAYVDYVTMPPDPLPLVTRMQEDRFANPPNDETQQFAERWYRNFDRSNHQFLFGCQETTSITDGVRAIARALSGFTYSHVMVRPILGATGSAASRRLLGEIVAHELAHQWQVNRWSSNTSGGHCGEFKYYDDPSKYCLMHYTYGPPGSALPEFTDDIVRFHYVANAQGAHSEYRWIRERCDPIPISTFSSSFDWWTAQAPPCR